MPGRADPHAALACDAGHVAAERRELAHHVAGRVADRRRDLQHGLHQLRCDAGLELVSFDRREHRLDVLDEIERLAVEEHVLLLDPERVRVARAVLVVEHASRVRGALARDRGRDRLPVAAHGDVGLGLDLDEPARVEEVATTTDVLAGLIEREDLAVRARDLVEVVRARRVDPRAHDVLEARARLVQRVSR